MTVGKRERAEAEGQQQGNKGQIREGETRQAALSQGHPRPERILRGGQRVATICDPPVIQGREVHKWLRAEEGGAPG